MRRQFGLFTVIGLLVAVLAFGTVAGLVIGGVTGYYVGSRADRQVTAPAATVAEDKRPVQSETLPGSVDEIIAAVNPAVVTIENRQGGRIGGMGSGFIIDEQGHVVTNSHVIAGADSLNVIFSDGTRAAATLVGADQFQDVAVLKIEDADVPATVEFGDSAALQPGQRVIAIGSALGEFRNTVTDGIVSATDRGLDTGQGYRLANLVQHNAPINPGNSGGPLLDLDGKVVGMNTAVVRGGFGQPGAEGLGFAVAGNTVEEYVVELIANGRIARPYLGITFRPAGPVIPGRGDDRSQPVIVVEVAPGSPAAEAGIEPGDTIIAVDGTEFSSQQPFLNTLFTYEAGETIRLTIQTQDGARDEIQITLGERPAP